MHFQRTEARGRAEGALSIPAAMPALSGESLVDASRLRRVNPSFAAALAVDSNLHAAPGP